MSRWPRPCPSCGARVPAGGICPRCAGQRRPSSCRECGRRTADGGPYCAAHLYLASEAARVAKQPYRLAYRDPLYHKHRAQRYKLAGGCCEDCGVPVGKSEYECDHVVPLSQGGTNEIENLRIRCTLHHHLKTSHDRRERGRA